MRWKVLILIMLIVIAETAQLKSDRDMFWIQFMSKRSIQTAYEHSGNLPPETPNHPNSPSSRSRMNRASHDHPFKFRSENSNVMNSSKDISRIKRASNAKPKPDRDIFWIQFTRKRSIRAAIEHSGNLPPPTGLSRMKKASNAKPKPGNDMFWIQFMKKRSIRAAYEDFSTLQTRISSLARVVTGVALLNGLSTDSIPNENVISELLNVASFKIEDLENFDKTKVDTFAGTLKEATKKLSKDTEVLEKSITDLNEIKEMWSDVVDLDKLPDKQKFQNIKNVALLDLKAINDFSPDDASKLRTLEDSVKGINEKLAPIRELIDSLKPFQGFVKVMQFYDTSSGSEITSTRPDDVTKMVQAVGQLESIPIPELSVISSMASVIASRFGVSVVQRKFTPGFINGFRDLKNLGDDVKDPWVSGIVGAHNSLESLKSLESLDKKMTELDSKWSTVNAKDTLTKATSIGNSFGKFSGSSTTISEIVDHLKRAPVVPSGKKLIGEISGMDKNIWALSKKIYSLMEIEKIISDGQTDSNSISSKLAPHLEVVKNAPSLAEISSAMMKDEHVITDFSSTCTHYLALFNYVKDMQFDLKSIASALKLSLNLRGLESEFYSKLEAASNSIQESTKLITEVKSEVDRIKKTPIDSLTGLKDLGEHSKSLGDAAAVINLVQKASEKSKELGAIVSFGEIMDNAETYIDYVGALSIIHKNWVQSGDLRYNLMIMISEIKQRIEHVKLPTEEGLDKYGSVLEKFMSLGDVQLDVERRLVAIDALLKVIEDKNSKNELYTLKNSLEHLYSLDLGFVQFNPSLTSISRTLAGIETIFRSTTFTIVQEPKYTKKPSIFPPVPEPEPTTEAGNSEISIPQRRVKSNWELYSYLYVPAIFGCPIPIMSSIVVITKCVYDCRRRY